jgi:hypothetical protein
VSFELAAAGDAEVSRRVGSAVLAGGVHRMDIGNVVH